MSEKTYYRYMEFCDNEGELWNGFIETPSTKEEQNLIKKLEDVCKLFENDCSENEFSLEYENDQSLTVYTQNEVDLLIRENYFSRNGYRSPYCIVSISDSILEKDIQNADDVFDLLYKFGVFKDN